MVPDDTPKEDVSLCNFDALLLGQWRWNNHFHLSRLHLVFKYDIKWTYTLSPKLSDYLNKYKAHKHNEYLIPPKTLKRGNITTPSSANK